MWLIPWAVTWTGTMGPLLGVTGVFVELQLLRCACSSGFSSLLWRLCVRTLSLIGVFIGVRCCCPRARWVCIFSCLSGRFGPTRALWKVLMLEREWAFTPGCVLPSGGFSRFIYSGLLAVFLTAWGGAAVLANASSDASAVAVILYARFPL